MSFTAIHKIITKKFGQTPLSQKITAAMICDEFNKLVLQMWGQKIKNQAQAVYVRNKVLTVACLSPVVAQEIKMRERELLCRLAGRFGEGVVERLRLLT